MSRSRIDKSKPYKVKVVDSLTGEVKYEGIVYPQIRRMDAIEIHLDNNSSRIHYLRDDTEKLIYIE